MFGIARRSSLTASRRVDRQKTEGHLTRSFRSIELLPRESSSHYHSYNNATVWSGYQRLLESASGSLNSSSSNEDHDRRKYLWRNLDWESKSFTTKLNNPIPTCCEPLDRIRMPSSSMSLAHNQRPLVEWTQASLSSKIAARIVLHDPIHSSLGIGFRGSSLSSVSGNPGLLSNRRYLSTESGSSKSKYKTSAKIPTPKEPPNNSMFNFSTFDPKALLKSMLTTTWTVTKAILTFLVKLPMNIFYYVTHPQERREKVQEIKGHARKEFDHYWTGTKLLMADVRTARDLLRRTLSGSSLTRRERKQLLRTVTDLFRLVPFSMFLIVPLAEFALPFALRLFPNMLPSTFQDSLKAEESMKRELQSRIAMAHFFQETLEELAKEQKRIAAKKNVESPDNEIANKQEQSAASMLEFLELARKGEMMPPDVIVQYAKYFQDDLTLDNMPRMQLVNMCRYMQLQPYGADSFLRFQLRHRIRQLKEDDQRIIWEGIDSLTKMELREACQERGMRSTGLSKDAYKKSLQQWLDLSVHKNVPISLLIMSRTFFLQEEITSPATGDDQAKSVASLADAISGLDKDVLNEVILEVATQEEKNSNPDIRKIKLEVVTHQNERIREEREAAERKKKVSERTELPPPEEPLAAIELELSPEQAEKLKKIVGAQRSGPDGAMLKTKDMSPSKEPTHEEVKEAVAKVEEEREHELSAAEMDAISQLLSADPVSREREELARIKSAISEKQQEEEAEEQETEEESSDTKTSGAEKVEEAFKTAMDGPEASLDDKQASATIENLEKIAANEAEKSTVFSTKTQMSPPSDFVSSGEDVSNEEEEANEEEEEDEEEAKHEDDPVVARLKRRLESMVDKIELQLSDVEDKIGDKLHILDKDKDGVLSRQEMAECLHLVLKREITFDEAMEIAGTMDENEDGVFTVQELIKWIETNKLVQLENEGRDADMDRIMESQSSESSKEEKAKGKENPPSSRSKSEEETSKQPA